MSFGFRGLSLSLVRSHRKLYVPIFALSALMSVILIALFSIYFSIDKQQPNVGLSLSAKRVFELSLLSMKTIFNLLVWSNAILGVALLYALLKDLIGLRRREFGQLRLLGFSSRMLWSMSAKELLIVQGLAAVLGIVFSVPCSYAIVALGEQASILSSEFSMHLDLGAMFTGAFIVLLSGQFANGSFFLFHRKVSELEFYRSTKTRSHKSSLPRLALGYLLLAVCLGGLFFLPISTNETTVMAMFLSMSIIFPVILLAPEIIRGITSFSRWLFTKSKLPYNGLVNQRFQHFSSQQSKLMLPILLTVGLVGGFFVGGNAVYATEAKSNLEFLADKHVAVPADQISIDNFDSMDAGADSVKVASYSGYSDLRNNRLFFTFVNMGALARMKSLEVAGGDLDEVRGNKVAVSAQFSEKYQLGSSVEIVTPDGETLSLIVGAVVDIPSALGNGFLVDLDSFPRHQAELYPRYIFFDGHKDFIGFDTLSSSGFAAKVAEQSRQSQLYSNLFLLGFVYIFSGFSLLVNLRESMRSRQSEFMAMFKLGFTHRRIRKLCLLETLVFLLLSLIFVSAVLEVAYWRVGLSINAMLQRNIATFPWEQTSLAFLFFAVISISVAATTPILPKGSYGLKGRGLMGV